MVFPSYATNPVFLPGPTNIPEIIRRAADLPTIDHRSAEFANILKPALAGVRAVLKGENANVFVFPSTGTGGWEAAVSNTLSPGDTVLTSCFGVFSQRWIDLCKNLGVSVQVIDAPWGEGMPFSRIEETLAADKSHKIKAVLATHNETATGVCSDIALVRRALEAAKHPALLFVDGVSSIGSIDFKMDEWNVDIAVTGSQKGFMLPPGLGIVAFSSKAMAAISLAKLPRAYFDIRNMAANYEKGEYPYTPSAGLLNALKTSTQLLLAEGLDNVFSRHAHIAGGVRAAVSAWELDLVARDPSQYSNTVTAIRTPETVNANEIVRGAAARYGVAFGGGLGPLSGKVFRIGHIGCLTEPMMLTGIATAEMAMRNAGMDIPLGAGVKAAQSYFLAAG